MCEICRQTFLVSAKPPLLYQHVVAKHDGVDPKACFPVLLKDFDPKDPKGEKKPATSASGGSNKPKKSAKKKDSHLDDLLNAGLSATKKKK